VEIRDFDSSRDLPAVRSCLVELQDHERQLDPRMPTGEESTDAYLDWMFRYCREYDGRLLVAESDSEVVGMVMVWTRYHSGEPNEVPGEHAYVPDLVVAASHRGRGTGRALLRAAESLARETGADRLGLSVLAGNTGARSLYAAEGFTEIEVTLEKRLDD
jgi:ribosomal protein S18 acetylase RimI-like enzyme